MDAETTQFMEDASDAWEQQEIYSHINGWMIGEIVKWCGFIGTVERIEDKVCVKWVSCPAKGITWFTLDGKLLEADSFSLLKRGFEPWDFIT